MNFSGSPNDFDSWQAVASSSALLAVIQSTDDRSPAALERWRSEFGADHVRIALELNDARRRMESKWPGASNWIVDRQGAEQASSKASGIHKAQRIQERGMTKVTDLMCGVGGDSAAFTNAKLETRAVDLDPFRAQCAGHNALCPFAIIDVENYVNDGSFLHLDPPRRDSSGRRRHHWQELLPSAKSLYELQTRVPQGVYKLSPATDANELDLSNCRFEWLSENGRLTQCLAWWGDQPTNHRSVTRLDDGWSFEGEPTPEPESRGSFGTYLVRADPLLERSDLAGAYARSCESMESVHPGLGLLTTDVRPTGKGLNVWEVEEVLPWREKKLRAAIRARGGGEVIVHTRGRSIDPDNASKSLRGEGDQTVHLWCVRLGSKRMGVFVKRPT